MLSTAHSISEKCLAQSAVEAIHWHQEFSTCINYTNNKIKRFFSKGNFVGKSAANQGPMVKLMVHLGLPEFSGFKSFFSPMGIISSNRVLVFIQCIQCMNTHTETCELSSKLQITCIWMGFMICSVKELQHYIVAC